jgi:hypothetical protein
MWSTALLYLTITDIAGVVVDCTRHFSKFQFFAVLGARV